MAFRRAMMARRRMRLAGGDDNSQYDSVIPLRPVPLRSVRQSPVLTFECRPGTYKHEHLACRGETYWGGMCECDCHNCRPSAKILRFKAAE